jgi:two-component system response regulator
VHKQVKKVVLVMVDDDEDDCFLVEAALREACFNCTFRCVNDGLEMIDYLSRNGHYQDSEAAPMPDIILLDLNMPRMNGRQVLKQLKADSRFRAIPVIILTTSSDEEDVRACYELGANSYITKGASFDGILSIIKSIHEYWLEIATLPPRVNP